MVFLRGFRMNFLIYRHIVDFGAESKYDLTTLRNMWLL